MIFQNPEDQLFEETVEKDIAFGLKKMGLPDEEIEKRVIEAAEITGLPKEVLADRRLNCRGVRNEGLPSQGLLQ